jgi:hypothetical protein
VTLQGAVGDHPSHDPDGFDAFVSSLRSPLAGFLDQLTPDSPVYRYARCANRRVDYHRIRPSPAGLIVIGNAVSALNLRYGQGKA